MLGRKHIDDVQTYFLLQVGLHVPGSRLKGLEAVVVAPLLIELDATAQPQRIVFHLNAVGYGCRREVVGLILHACQVVVDGQMVGKIDEAAV